jgi:hypothetical protein
LLIIKDIFRPFAAILHLLRYTISMKKGLHVFALVLGLGSAAFAQTSVTGVSMTAENKVVIMEEFTGVRCTYCPDGKIILDGIITANPDNFRAISMHPQNSGLTAPYGNDPDLRRTFLDGYYSTPYCGSSRFMPSAFINRRIWANERIQGRGSWASRVDEVKMEASPVNVGVLANYDSLTHQLSVTVEAYYTSTVSDLNALYVHLSEDNLTVQQQSGATGAYVQDLVFRESMTAQWGDAIPTTTQGTLHTATFTFDNSAGNYDMSQCKVIAYVENKTNTELYSGWQAQVSFAPAVGIVAAQPQLDVNVLPNPFQGSALLSYYLPEATDVSYTVTSLQGQTVARIDLGAQAAGTHNVTLDAENAHLAAGIYVLQLRAGENTVTKRVVVN